MAIDEREYVYRGRRIRIEAEAGRRLEAKEMVRRDTIDVDGKAIAFERTPEGIRSHAIMNFVFASPYELAEELIRQAGDGEIRADEHGEGHHE